jgi:hypothetical protein
LLFGLVILSSIKVRHVEAFGNSLLVVQQVSGECQCLEGSLNAYLDKCLDVIKFNFDNFCIHHIPKHENCRANDLAQGASSYNVESKNFHVKAKLMLGGEKILLCTEPDGLTATPAGLTATQTGQTTTRRGQTTEQASQTATHAGQTARTQGGNSSSVSESGHVEEDLRKPIICEIQARRLTKLFGISLSSLL